MGVESHLLEKWGPSHLASVGRGREEENGQSRGERAPGGRRTLRRLCGKGSEDSLSRWKQWERAEAKDWGGRGEARSEGIPHVAPVSIGPQSLCLKHF